MAILKTITAPSLPVVRLEPFTPSAFAPFGTCIQTPTTSDSTSAIAANQGSAAKFPSISPIAHRYRASSPAAEQKMHIFSCQPRQLPVSGVFAVEILERHPFTTQTFVPLSVDEASGKGEGEACFAVIVAPTREDGWPDLAALRAFAALPGQAVTYAMGTWHAPMVVLRGRVEFVVLVAENGTDEDCEEVIVDGGVGVKLVEEGNWGLWEKEKARL